MLDNQLIQLVIAKLKLGMASLGDIDISSPTHPDTSVTIPAVKVLQSYQPRAQGVNTLPTLYLYKLFDERVGVQTSKSSFITSTISTESDAVITTEDGQPIQVDGGTDGQMTTTESQLFATHFQLSAMVIQDPADINSVTASDVANFAAFVMNSASFVDALRAQNVGILKVSQVRNPILSDDMDRFEATPSFDFILTHKQAIVMASPAVEVVEFQFLRV